MVFCLLDVVSKFSMESHFSVGSQTTLFCCRILERGRLYRGSQYWLASHRDGFAYVGSATCSVVASVEVGGGFGGRISLRREGAEG